MAMNTVQPGSAPAKSCSRVPPSPNSFAAAAHKLDRRAALGAILFTPIAAVPLVASGATAGTLDAEIIEAWTARQQAIAAIYARGDYREAECHSPAENDIMDAADMKISDMRATTPQGALAKAWVAWTYQGTEFHPDDQRIGDMIRKADIEALERETELDFQHETMLGLVLSLRALAGEE